MTCDKTTPADRLTREQFDRWAYAFPAALVDTLVWMDIEPCPGQDTPVHDDLPKKYDSAESAQSGLADVALMERAFGSVTYDDPEFFEAFNRLFSNAIQTGGPEGTPKEIVGAVLVEGGFIPKIKVTKSDGSSYIAPVTLPNRDESDTEVLIWTFKDFFASLGVRKMALLDLARFAAEGEPLNKNA